MRLLWYAGASTALAAGVVAYAFNQRANFYSAMVYLSQNNLSLMILVNLVLLIYASFVWGLQRLCFGPLRPVEIEQLYEKAWFAVTETCLAMTIFREEVGGWFLVMFTALVTGKVWEWIGEGRVEIMEQQPPANPRLFHSRLIVSLLISVAYDSWLFLYAVNSVIQQARPNMMVMFLFEFAILATCSSRTFCRYLLSLAEANIVKTQTRNRLEERRKLAREQRLNILQRRESGDDAVAEAARQEELPNEEDIDELDIEVPGWESKGHWILSLDLLTDFLKLIIYSVFFGILMMFYGLPIHIMRDLFMTARSFVKRLGALMRYRRALQDMNKYADATHEDLMREDTCIICREEMRPWDPSAVGSVERSRPKKLPCGHILHFGCLKGWLERQQVCPTCRRSVVLDGTVSNNNGAARPANGNGQAQPAAPAAHGGNGGVGGAGGGGGGAGGGDGAGEGVGDGLGAGVRDNGNPLPHRRGNLRVFQLGPIRLGFAQGNAQDIHELADQLRLGEGGNQPLTPAAAAPTPGPTAHPAGFHHTSSNMEYIQAQLEDLTVRVQHEMNALQATQAELQTLYALTAELNRLRQTHGQAGINAEPMFHHLPQFPHSSLYAPSSPLARYGGSPYASAIPSGSQDLPEGVSIPPGWTLLPLQRLDVPTAPVQTESQPTPTAPTHDYPQQNLQVTPPSSRAPSARPLNGSASPSTEPADAYPSIRGSDAQNVNYGTPEPFASRPSSESSDVVPPDPVLPQWGGSSQALFGTGSNSSTPATIENSTSKSEVTPETESQPLDSSDSSDDDGSDVSSTKGKARAVTVEDLEEDGSD